MHTVYRGWLLSIEKTNDETAEVTTAKKNHETIKGIYENVVREIDRIEFKKQEEEI